MDIKRSKYTQFALLLPCNVIVYDPSMCINVKCKVTDVDTIGPTGRGFPC